MWVVKLTLSGRVRYLGDPPPGDPLRQGSDVQIETLEECVLWKERRGLYMFRNDLLKGPQLPLT